MLCDVWWMGEHHRKSNLGRHEYPLSLEFQGSKQGGWMGEPAPKSGDGIAEKNGQFRTVELQFNTGSHSEWHMTPKQAALQ